MHRILEIIGSLGIIDELAGAGSWMKALIYDCIEVSSNVLRTLYNF